MTVICAIKDPERERVIITSNQTATYHDMVIRRGPMWRTCEGWGLGLAGDVIAQNLADEHAKEILTGLDSPASFRERWRAVLKRHDFDLKVEDPEDVAPGTGQSAILASNEAIWAISPNLGYIEVEGSFYACGTGKQIAIGAAHALEGLGVGPEEIIERATRAAIEISDSCAGPMWVGQVR